MDDRPRPGQPGQQTGQVRPLSERCLKALEGILRNAGSGGCVELASHFKMRAAQRGFTTPQALGVLKRGVIVGSPEFCPDFCNWKFTVEGEHDNGILCVVASVSAGDQGQVWSGSVMLVTGYVR
jgi:hypothetical protein